MFTNRCNVQSIDLILHTAQRIVSHTESLANRKMSLPDLISGMGQVYNSCGIAYDAVNGGSNF